MQKLFNSLREKPSCLRHDVQMANMQSPFFLVYPLEKGQCCFLINKKLDTTSWEPFFPSPDLCILKQVVDRTGHLRNPSNAPHCGSDHAKPL